MNERDIHDQRNSYLAIYDGVVSAWAFCHLSALITKLSEVVPLVESPDHRRDGSHDYSSNALDAISL